ncbi:MAG: hypothetical protein Q8N05_14835 [Bacteroidota bacterium]|nr:hypothetical protein [Bacteroidota bacterium]
MKMKRLAIFSVLLALATLSFSQDITTEKLENTIKFQISSDLYSDLWMQWERYLDTGKDYYPGNNDMIPGFTIELSKPSKLKNINYLAGTTFFRFDNNVEANISYKSIHENQLTGGGAFIGAEFSPQYKVIGFSIKMAVGYFNLSRTIIRFSDNPLDSNSIENNVSSGSLANILQGSLICKLGRVYLQPSAKLIFTGGNQMSVIMPGVSLGLGYTFK